VARARKRFVAVCNRSGTWYVLDRDTNKRVVDGLPDGQIARHTAAKMNADSNKPKHNQNN
jgi:hypothetical protein